MTRRRPIESHNVDVRKEQTSRPRVLIVYGDLLEYRVPIFDALGDFCDLTVSHSGRRLTDGNAKFIETILPRYRIGRLHYQHGLRQLIRNGGFDTVIYFMDLAWPATVFNFLWPPRPVRRVIWGLWRTGRTLPDMVRVWLARRADHNVFYSSGAAEDFIACGVPRGHVAVARNTVRIDNPGRNETSERNTILVVGSFNPRKQNDITLAAFLAICAKMEKPIRLVFVGEGSQLKYIRSLAEQSDFPDRIDFYPACHEEDVLRHYYDRAVCSVSHGQAGLSVLQSFAYGVPFVTREGAISGGEIENIVSGVNGFVTSGSQSDLETVLKRLIDNPEEADAMGRAALEYYTTRASTSHMVRGFIEAIDTQSIRNGSDQGAKERMLQCEACGSRACSFVRLRPNLAYWICHECGHCLIDSGNDGLEENFKKAQRTYFSEDSILVQSEPGASERDILALRKKVALAFLSPQSKVLEVGPGAGFFSEWLQKRGHKLRLIEHSPVLAAALERKLRLPVDTREFETINFVPNSFDVFCSFHVIEHVPDPLRHLTVGLLAVRPGGIAIVATPNARSWEQIWFRMLSPNFDAAHLRVFSTASLRRFCEKAGWEVVRVETPEFASSWLRVLSRVLRMVRGEDENLTAGKYAEVASARYSGIYAILAALTFPLRQVQQLAKGGNEVLLVLRKPIA